LLRTIPENILYKMKRDTPKIVVSGNKGKIYDFQPLEAAGMKGGVFFRLPSYELIKLPCGSELFMLPNRVPVGYDNKEKRFVVLKGVLAVAAFVPPGHTITYNSAYAEINKPKMLPLFSYGAVVFYKGEFYVAATRVDKELRHDLRFMNMDLARKNAARYKKLFPRNRLIKHLENCAFIYGCPTAKNFFLGKYECPLPAAPHCNARCIGCISYQPNKRCAVAQPRIKFLPTPEEVAEVALYHIKNVKDPVASFGQGCEGEPLLVDKVIEKSIRLIRSKTDKGIININTNASRPEVIAKLLDIGLNSIRVSLNSARECYYVRYYKPKGYTFRDMIKSIKITNIKKGFVSINYLTMPGFTDSEAEFAAFRRFVESYKIDMIQWRNLNFDPLRYFKELKIPVDDSKPLGIRQIICSLKKSFPRIMMGYFNPSKCRIKRKRMV